MIGEMYYMEERHGHDHAVLTQKRALPTCIVVASHSSQERSMLAGRQAYANHGQLCLGPNNCVHGGPLNKVRTIRDFHN